MATCSPSDTVTLATKKMKEHRMNSVIITSPSNKPTGILTWVSSCFTTNDCLLLPLVCEGMSDSP